MLAYHGTSLERWKTIKKQGLTPRGENGKSNWTHSIESNPDTIYLTDAYAMNFALASINSGEPDKDHAVLIEIDTDRLNPDNLVPDEDALEQVSRKLGPGGDRLPPHWSMVERTRYYRGMVREYAEKGLDFDWSMSELGTAGHVGAINCTAFTRVAIIDIKIQRKIVWEYMNSQVSVYNYQFLGPQYRSYTRMLFGDAPRPEDVAALLTPLTTVTKKGIKVLTLNRTKEMA